MDPRDPICERLGELAAAAAPVDSGPPDARQWGAIDAEMDRRSGRGRRRWWRALALSTVAVGLVTFLVVRRPLDYRVHGCPEVGHGASCAGAQGVVSFSDGTQVALDSQTQIRVEPLAFGRGAEIALDDGNANLSVIHRARAQWVVNAGPYRVEVTGTRFRVSWSKARQTLAVSVTEGEVHVSGGSLRQTAVLRAGQSLHSGAQAETAEAPQAPARDSSATAWDIAATKEQNDPRSSRPVPPRSGTKRPRPAPARLAQSELALEPPRPLAPATTERRVEPGGDKSWVGDEPRLVRDIVAAPAQSERSTTRAPLSVAFAPDGSLVGAMTGATWLIRGDGTKLSAPATRERALRLRPQADGLCTSGTVAGLRCVNEDTPKARCNWDTNWGVAIRFGTRSDEQAWGDGAPKRIAVEFHGRQAIYRLNAHRKVDPHKKNYCIENYRSGQPVTASMFKSRCWEDAGETLPDFADVDLFNLQFSAGMDYVAFHYCVSAIRLDP